MGTNSDGEWQDTWGLIREKQFIDGLGTHARPWLNHYDRVREVDPEERLRLLKLYEEAQKDSPDPMRRAAVKYAKELLLDLERQTLGIKKISPEKLAIIRGHIKKLVLKAPGSPVAESATKDTGRPKTPTNPPATVNPGPPASILCACGCGWPVKLAPRNNSRKGWVKGQPLTYIRYHNLRGEKK